MKRRMIRRKTLLGIVTAFVISAFLSSIVNAEVWIDAFIGDSNELLPWKDPNDPYLFVDIMAGTSLRLELSSTEGGPANGQLISPLESANVGQLFGRQCDSLLCPGSITEQATERSRVRPISGSINGEAIIGYTYTISRSAVPGPWLVFDYNACSPGEVEIEWTEKETTEIVLHGLLRFPQVFSREYSKDTIVSLRDFAYLANHWRKVIVEDTNDISRIDLDENTLVEPNDLKLFSDFWLALSHKATCPKR